MTLREQIAKLRRDFPKRHPIIKGMVFIALFVAPITFIAYSFGWGDEILQEDMKEFISKTDLKSLFIEMVLKAPIIEETLYRGPGFLMLMLCSWISWMMKRNGRNPFLENRICWRIRLEDLVVWPAILIPTYFWAEMHPFPLPIFCAGIIFGWIMMRARNILCNIAAHAILNAIVLLGVVLRFSAFY